MMLGETFSIKDMYCLDVWGRRNGNLVARLGGGACIGILGNAGTWGLGSRKVPLFKHTKVYLYSLFYILQDSKLAITRPEVLWEGNLYVEFTALDIGLLCLYHEWDQKCYLFLMGSINGIGILPTKLYSFSDALIVHGKLIICLNQGKLSMLLLLNRSILMLTPGTEIH